MTGRRLGPHEGTVAKVCIDLGSAYAELEPDDCDQCLWLTIYTGDPRHGGRYTDIFAAPFEAGDVSVATARKLLRWYRQGVGCSDGPTFDDVMK